MTSSSDAYARITEENIRLNEEITGLKKQNEKLLRKFKRIPATVADAYNESVVLREDLILALETTQILQAGISWFNVDEQNEIMEKLYIKYHVGWSESDAEETR